jgi:ParB-like chromosome segregation protein Spo0J
VEIREIPLKDLILDPNLYLRDRLDDFTVERYADSWERLPPSTVYEVDGKFLLADGFHRHAAAVMLGRKTMAAEVRHGSFNEALDFVSEVNLFHGLPLTRAERRRAVEVKMKLHHDWSDRRMAEELGVSRELVAKTRKMLIEGRQIPNNPGRVGADGKMYTSAGLPKDPNEHRPKGKAIAQQDEPHERARREPEPPAGMKSAPLAPAAAPPWEGSDAKKVALSPPVPAAAPTIEEMLGLLAKQIMEVISWTQVEGFVDAYRTASGNARGLFQTAVFKLAARADQLRKA